MNHLRHPDSPEIAWCGRPVTGIGKLCATCKRRQEHQDSVDEWNRQWWAQAAAFNKAGSYGGSLVPPEKQIKF